MPALGWAIDPPQRRGLHWRRDQDREKWPANESNVTSFGAPLTSAAASPLSTQHLLSWERTECHDEGSAPSPPSGSSGPFIS